MANKYLLTYFLIIKNRSVEHVLTALNNLYSSIKFNYETESGDKLSLLDVQLIRTGDNIETCVFRKPTNTDIYIHWNSFAPFPWKCSTLKTLVYRAYIFCSDNQRLESEFNYLMKVFHIFNSYPHWFLTRVINEVKNNFIKQFIPPTTHQETIDGENNKIRKPIMILPYAGERGCTLIESSKKNLQKALPINIQTRIVYTGTKLSSQLKNIKDPTSFDEKHDIVYQSFCSAENCNENYIGESARRLHERVKDHNGRDRNCHFFKHSTESRHVPVLENDFKKIGKGYRNNTHRRKIAEDLLIKKMKLSLNI